MTRLVLSGAFLALLATPSLAPAQQPASRAGATAITNVTIVPVSGPRIANGTVVIQNGRIAAAGAGVAVPQGATVIDGRGLYVYPGLIDSGTRLGLTEIGSVPGGNDTQELGDFNPHNAALTAVNPHSEIIPTVRVNGVTTVITSAQGGLIQGQAALIDLAGWTPDEMAVVPRVAMVMTYPRIGGGGGRFGGGGGGGGGGQGGAESANRQVQQLMTYLRDAKAYSQRGSRERTNLAFEAMGPLLRGEMPVVFDVQSAQQIRGALALADSFRLKVIIRGGSEAWQLADTLAARRIPVIVGPTTTPPSGDDPYDAVYANPGVLARAGVVIAFQTSSASDSRNLPFNAALATAYGLDPDEALKALTINPARIWGVADQLGSIEPGKMATLIVTTGDPLDVRTQIKHVFIQGEATPMDDRHTKLYEKFRNRPKP